MKAIYTLKRLPGLMPFLVFALALPVQVFSQTCPASGLTNFSGTFPNTYFPAAQASLASGSKSINLAAASYGNHSIVPGDLLLIIQMQGAGINTANSNLYGDKTGTGRGYLNDVNLFAGNMEFVVATNTVTTAGGTVNLQSGLKNSYRNQGFGGSFGQFIYQVIYVPMYYDLKLAGTVTVPAWNGRSGGVLMFVATDNFDFNGQTINGAGLGFRGGASRQLTGGTGNSTDYVTMSTVNNNGGKGEGLAGMPRFINNNFVLLDNGSSLEGYPNGAEARGAPGNAGGGGTDYDPSVNDQNSGGGGGGNGGIGGGGGNSWSTNKPVGGIGGAALAQVNPKRLVMGGGGGGGTTNNGTGGNSGIYSSGVAGGAIVIIYAGTLSGTGTINVTGASGATNVQNDGSGGAGAGGSVLIYNSAASNLTGVTVTADGGTGGSNSGNGAMHGPGGGGGGGVIYSTTTLNAATSANGGSPGTTYNNSNYGATGGSAGIVLQNMDPALATPFPVTCALLPVNFLSFTAQPANGDVTLNWVVESQTASGYVVERSFDGNSFSPIGTVSPQSGNNSSNSYTYNDNDANSPTGTLFYRIREDDVTGQQYYSNVVVLKTSNPAASAAGIYPNPTRESFTLTFTSTSAGAVSLRLFDLSGRLVLNRPFQAATGVNAVTVGGLGALPEGMYLLQWFDGLKPWTSKVIIRR